MITMSMLMTAFDGDRRSMQRDEEDYTMTMTSLTLIIDEELASTNDGGVVPSHAVRVGRDYRCCCVPHGQLYDVRYRGR
jgi:hypothetical protein